MKDVEIREFSGLRNTSLSERFSPGDLDVAVNCDLDDTKHLSRRGGFVSKVSGVSHSIWSDNDICLFVVGGALKRLWPGYTTETLRTGLTDLPMNYLSPFAGTVYYSNIMENGVVKDGVSRSWGVPVPTLPEVSVVPGYLPKGTYQYTITYLRDDGQESGAPLSGVIELTESKGLAFSAIASNTYRKAIYLSSPNGENLYRAQTINATDTSITITSPRLGILLTTQFCKPPPAGHILAEYNGRVYVARDNVLYPSEPHLHELFTIDRSFIPFATRITMVAPVASGIFVGTERQTVFMSGPGPESFGFVVKADHGVIPGTLTYVDGQFVGDGISGNVPMWASPLGNCVGTDDGSFRNLTGKRFRHGSAALGAGCYRQTGTLNQYIVSLTA